MNFVSIEQLWRDVQALSCVIPPHRIVAGIERSGILPAQLLAEKWGARAIPFREACLLDDADVLVLDDSLNYGGAMIRARQQAAGKEYHYAAVYVSETASAALVDYYCRILPRPRVFQWNLFKHDLLLSACIDMDGVICKDCTFEENDDGIKYAAFLDQTAPLHIPQLEVAAIVTGRLEKHRKQTERWLHRNGVSYTRLVMMPFDKPEKRQEYGIARFKAETYRDAAYKLFVESDTVQASLVASLTGKPVICTPESGEWRLYG